MPIYKEYKLATEKFVQWIIKAAGKINPLSKNLPNTASNLNRRVELIINCDALLLVLMVDEYLPSLEEVLLDGHRAIKLREKVTRLHLNASRLSGRVNESDETHAHYVKILKDAHSKLKLWYNKQINYLNSSVVDEDLDSDVNNSNAGSSANRYEALSDESLFEYGVDVDELCGEMETSFKGDTPVRDFNLDEIDEDGEKVKTIVLCFVIDMVSLLRKIQNAWKQVVLDSMHVVVAVSISVAALQALDRQFAEVQSILPSIEDATTFLVSICEKYLSSSRIGDGVLSKFYADMMMYLQILRKFANTTLRNIVLDGQQWAAHYLPEDRPRFIEQHTLLSITPTGLEEFLFVQLCLLHKKISILASQKITLDEVYSTLPSSRLFLRSFRTFFETKVVTTAVLVRCMIWVQIIAVLQDKDNLTMGRTVYIMRKYCRKVLKMLSPDEEILCYEKHLPPHDVRSYFTAELHSVNLDDNYKLWHHNPLLQGMHLLDLIIQNDGGYTRSMLTNGVSILHLYSALKAEGFVKPQDSDIPLFELLESIINPKKKPKAPVARGRYSASALNEVVREAKLMSEYLGVVKRRRGKGGKPFKAYRSGKKILSEAGPLYFFLFEQDLSNMGEDVPLSSSELVDTICNITQEGMFETRALSLAALKLARIFNSLSLRIAAAFPQLTEEVRTGRDYPPDGICADPVKVSSLASACQMEINIRILSQLDHLETLGEEKEHVLREQCQKISAIIVDTLKPINEEKELYIFKKDEREAIVREFGCTPLVNFLDRTRQSDPSIQAIAKQAGLVFYSLQDEFESFCARPAVELANKQVQESLIARVKAIVKKTPSCLQMTNLQDARFATIFDYVVCVLKNMDFAEWLVQMRGFLPRGDQFLRFALCGRIPGGVDQTHLQCASQYRVPWAIEFILAVSQGCDRNFVGFDCDNMALHYLVLMDDPIMLLSFLDYGSFVLIHENNDGKKPFDLAVSQEMKTFLKDTFMSKPCDVDEYNAQQREEHLRARTTVDRDLDIVRARSATTRRKARKDASAVTSVSAEDVARAERSEKELLEMLDGEEQKDNKSKKKAAKKSQRGRV